MLTTAPAPDYGNMSVDPDAYPRNMRCNLTIMDNGDIILDSDLLPERLNATDSDRYQLIDSGAGIVLKKL
jgi:hypothetical protein